MSGLSIAVGQAHRRSVMKRGIPLLATVVALLLAPSGVAAKGPAAGRFVAVDQMAQLVAARTLVPPKPNLEPESRTPRVNHASIVVTYHNFSAQAKNAFQAAVNIWKTHIFSTQVIHIDASWTPLNPQILGQAAPNLLYTGTDNRLYAPAELEAQCSCNINGTQVEIIAQFNSAFAPNGVDGWYYGTNGTVPNDKWDLESTVLHEVGHGLGFFSTMNVSGSNGMWGLGVPLKKDNFDAHEWSAATGGIKLAKPSAVPNNSAALKAQLTDGSVFFKGGHVGAVLGGGRAQLYSPNPWEPGSSNSHFDDAVFDGTPNALMTHSLFNGEAEHSPGPLTLALFQDIGWQVA